MDAFGFEDVHDGCRDVLVLALDQAGAHFDDGDLAAEPPEHLAEFQTDIAAADDDQVAREEIDIHHGGIGEVTDLVEPRHLGNDRARAHIDEDAFGGETPSPTATSRAETKRAAPLIDGAVRQALQPGLDAGAVLLHDGVFARFDAPHVDRHGPPSVTPNSAARRAMRAA